MKLVTINLQTDKLINKYRDALTIQVLEIMKLNIFKFRNKILIRQEKELKTITGWALKCEK